MYEQSGAAFPLLLTVNPASIFSRPRTSGSDVKIAFQRKILASLALSIVSLHSNWVGGALAYTQ